MYVLAYTYPPKVKRGVLPVAATGLPPRDERRHEQQRQTSARNPEQVRPLLDHQPQFDIYV